MPNEPLGVGGQEWDGNIDKNKAEQIFVMLLVTLGLHCPRTSVGKSLAMEFVTMFQSSINPSNAYSVRPKLASGWDSFTEFLLIQN